MHVPLDPEAIPNSAFGFAYSDDAPVSFAPFPASAMAPATIGVETLVPVYFVKTHIGNA